MGVNLLEKEGAEAMICELMGGHSRWRGWLRHEGLQGLVYLRKIRRRD